MKIFLKSAFSIVEIAMVTIIASVVIFTIVNSLKKTKDNAQTQRSLYNDVSDSFNGVMASQGNGVTFPDAVAPPSNTYGCPYNTVFPSPNDATTVQATNSWSGFFPYTATANPYGGSFWSSVGVAIKFNVDLGSPVIINRLNMISYNGGAAIRGFKVYGSNQASDFNNLTVGAVTGTMNLLGNFTDTTQPSNNTSNVNHQAAMNGLDQFFIFTNGGTGVVTDTNTVAYRYYIIAAETNWGGTTVISKVRFQQGTTGGTPDQLMLSCT